MVLSLKDDKWCIDKHETLKADVHPQITVEELNEADEAVRRNPTIIKLAADIGT